MANWIDVRDRVGLKLRPLSNWPGKPTSAYSREIGPYKADLTDTLATLARELAALNARDVVLEVDFRERDIRLDGLPRSNASMQSPGLILSFQSKHGPLRLHFDRFTKWESNLRAIALHLEHLRLAGLYGVGKDGQQYAGWKALPAPSGTAISTASKARVFIYGQAGLDPRKHMVNHNEAYRLAAKRLHPDSETGDHELFVQLQQAKAILDAEAKT
jgi:hypothetical protein